MEMEDHQQQQYSITDLRQLMNGPARSTTHFPTVDLFPAAAAHQNLNVSAATHQQYEMMMFGRQVVENNSNNIIMPPRCLHDFGTDAGVNNNNNNNNNNAGGNYSSSTITVIPPPTTTTTSASTPPLTLSGLEADQAGCCNILGFDASTTGRWPRQETLTLLDIRSRLHSKFKEANQKGPLWDDVSRIMSEEHGYQRSGKKCREKFENLYKYYKKTKEGKAGRQDGKHYRFFRQLEALYGTSSSTDENINQPSLPETNLIGTTTTLHNFQTNQDSMLLIHSNKQQCDSLSLTNSTEFNTSSSSSSDGDDDDYDNHSTGGLKENDSMEKRKKKMSSGKSSWKVKIKDFIDSQMKKLVEKQEEWLEKLTKTLEQKERERVVREEEWRKHEAERLEREHKFWAKERAWIEARDAALMEALQKITGSEIKSSSNIQSPPHDQGLILGAENQNEDGSGSKDGNGNKKRKENSSRNCFYFDTTTNNNDRSSSLYNQGLGGSTSTYCDMNDQREEIGRVQRNDGSSPSNSNAENCFHPFLMSTEGGNLWENYSLKVNKGSQNQ